MLCDKMNMMVSNSIYFFPSSQYESVYTLPPPSLPATPACAPVHSCFRLQSSACLFVHQLVAKPIVPMPACQGECQIPAVHEYKPMLATCYKGTRVPYRAYEYNTIPILLIAMLLILLYIVPITLVFPHSPP